MTSYKLSHETRARPREGFWHLKNGKILILTVSAQNTNIQKNGHLEAATFMTGHRYLQILEDWNLLQMTAIFFQLEHQERLKTILLI